MTLEERREKFLERIKQILLRNSYESIGYVSELIVKAAEDSVYLNELNQIPSSVRKFVNRG